MRRGLYMKIRAWFLPSVVRPWVKSDVDKIYDMDKRKIAASSKLVIGATWRFPIGYYTARAVGNWTPPRRFFSLID
ncbi:hypothetical protein L484_004110 [Morus notabilis]|uniref:Uncharacterized protein n=1 Tax=Morus notabilis TaxID=981085 RepID=W9RR88_9ROSA|nr:hypothetical protein L484_004110 [Morus notabilis]